VSTRTTEEQKWEEIEAARTEARASKRNYESVWHATYASYQNALMLSFLPAAADTAVLDCGCGVGVLLKDLLDRYPCVHGLDISAESLKLVECSHPALQGLVVGDAEQPPYADGVFDAVLLRGTLHHLANFGQGMGEFRRILKPGGVLVVAEPCSDVPFINWGRKLLSKRQEKAFGTRELRNLFPTAGFSVVGERRFGYLAFALTYVLQRPLASLSRPAWLWRSIIRSLILLDEMLGRIPFLNRSNLGAIVAGRALGESARCTPRVPTGKRWS